MDKLKPILAQKFWILFVVVLIMPLTGYFMSKGKLAAEIADRWGKLDKAFTDIPAGTGVPNESWTTKLNDINKQQILHNRRANQELWAKQRERMFWPKDIAPIMAKAEYFKDLTEEQKGGSVIFKYPLSYESQLRALWEIVDPLDDGINLRDSDKRRKVAFAMADLHQSNIAHLGTLQPTFADIWNAQEDIWLQTELLQAIRRLNANAISQGDAFVKQLGKIQLFGGAKSTGDGGGAAAAANSGGFVQENMGAAGATGFGMQRSDASALSADIKLSEEFDVSMEPSFGGGAASMGGFSSGAGGFTEPTSSGGASTGAAGPKTEVKRYIDLDEKQPYKRRAFYIKLTMDHRKVPDLIAELMNSPFPVEIIRVQQVWLSDTSNAPGGGSGPMGSGGTGFAGFKPPTTSSGDSSASSAPMPMGFTEDDMGLGNSSSGAGATAGRTASSNPGSAAALADPNLAQVAILGVWTLYLPPPPSTDAEQPAVPNTATPAPPLAVTPENTASPAEASAADAKPTTEPTEGTGDEAKKADDSDAPKSEPAKTEKAEPDSDKPAAEKAPPKDDAAEKSDSETK